jgi:hypothetical protein
MKIFKYILVLSCCYAMASCNFNPSPIPIEIDEPAQQLVISSFALPPQALIVTVSRTFSALISEADSLDLGNPDILSRVLVDSAQVMLTYAGRSVELFKIAPGVYGSVEVEQIQGETYYLTVKDFDTGLSTLAQTTALSQIELDTLYPTMQILPSFGDTLRSFKYSFLDPVGIENYFLVTYTRSNNIFQDILMPGNSLFNTERNSFNAFSDKTTGDGKQIAYEPSPLFEVGDTVLVGISNIPKKYYEFLSAYKKSGNLFSQLISEPINLPSNVEGGCGYFTLTIPKFKTVVIE